ncbi:hypothetical protein ACFC14_16355 [Microbacterium sp. NPDC055988]|uniref:hypothetical protein n=1 Tax=Microbacterium sp. NPDC055988 TaxID=3345671 RepID=UPI0035D63DF0
MTAPLRPGPETHALPPTRGAHELPPRFSSSPSPVAGPRARRRPRRGLVIGILGGAAVIAALGITQLSANLGYDDTADRLDDTLRTATAVKAETDHTRDTLTQATDAGHVILDVTEARIAVTEDAVSALSTAVAEGEEAGAAAETLDAIAFPSPGEKPVWFWELFGESAELADDENSLEDLVRDLEAASEDAAEAEDAVQETGLAVISAAAEAAAGFEAAHLSARNDAVIALRDAAADALAVTSIDGDAATTYVALQDAAAQIIATESEELAEKSGPLQGARLEIEAFARSLAPGVLLEFDWSPVVNGAGYNGSMGGYTTWWWDDPGRANIELSDSVAEQWPAERSKALVAHEVGHAISVKCQDMYDSSTQDSIEKWATAWAISMGYTDDANGVWAYGYPPQEYIDAAAGCR